MKKDAVTAQYLLEGVIYAVEQCGLLLNDAVTLYNGGKYASVIVLAAFAREELGKSRILREIRKKALEGRGVTLKNIERECGDHVKKQEWAQLSVVQRPSANEGLGKLLIRYQEEMRSNPQSEESKKLREQLNEVTSKQIKRTPADRHTARKSALYVEPNPSGTGWNRPRDISPEKAMNFLVDAVNDYSVNGYDRLQYGSIKFIDPEFSKALEQWTERPTLPTPVWPNQML